MDSFERKEKKMDEDWGWPTGPSEVETAKAHIIKKDIYENQFEEIRVLLIFLNFAAFDFHGASLKQICNVMTNAKQKFILNQAQFIWKSRNTNTPEEKLSKWNDLSTL